MTMVTDLLSKLTSLDVDVLVSESNKVFATKMLSEFKDQLWDGKNADGNNITPSYLDDPYFKTKKQAEAYANWKNRITPNSRRDKNTPNLFINGFFYDSLRIETDRSISFNGWGSVVTKYSDQLNLSPDSKEVIKKEGFEDHFLKSIEAQTGLKM